MKTALVASASILMSVVAQFLLKTGMREATGERNAMAPLWRAFANGWLGLGFTCYIVGAVLWLAVLSRWEVSKAYPMVGAGFALTLLIGLALGESIGLMRATGVALICVGIVLVSLT